MSIKFVQVYQREEKDFKLAHVNLFTHTQWLCVPCVRNFDAVIPVGVIRGEYKRTHIPRTRLIRHLDYIWYGHRTLSIQLDKKEWFTEFWILGGKVCEIKYGIEQGLSQSSASYCAKVCMSIICRGRMAKAKQNA